MDPLVLTLLMLVACGSCLAHYKGYESGNLIVREEPANEDNRDLVECPVCEEAGHWMPSYEECPITKDNKQYKKCALGTYINKVCGNRRDCYRGPGEQCTVKQDFDIYGQKCAPGYYCNKPLGICTGVGYVLDSKIQYLLKPFSNRRVSGIEENAYIRSE